MLFLLLLLKCWPAPIGGPNSHTTGLCRWLLVPCHAAHNIIKQPRLLSTMPPPPLHLQVMCIAAGTPNRLCKLADGGTLQLERLRHVVLDVQLDVKQRWVGGRVGGWVAAGARRRKREWGTRQAGL